MKSTKKYIAKMIVYFGTIMALIIFSLTALWLSRVIFNTDRFTSITVTAFSEPSSRESVGNLVASRIFEDTPVLKAILSDRLSNYISVLLGSEVAQSSVERLAREGQLLFTSPQREPIEIDITELKPVIASAQELIRKDETQRRINVEDIPDVITIIDTSTLPNFHKTSRYIFLAGPLALFAAFVLAGYWVKKGGKQNRYKRFRIVLLVVVASALVALLLGPLAEPTFISIGRDASTQTLLSNLYEEFTTPFRNQALCLGLVATFILLGTTAWHELNKRYALSFTVTKK